jgi:type I restriction enzyme S subunit
MSSKTKTTATKEEATPALVPKLRFPEFRNAEGWKSKRLGLALKFQAGFPFPSSGFNDAGKGLRLIRNRDLRSDDIVKFYSKDFDPNFVVNNGDVLVGMDGDFTPTVWEKGEALLNQRVGRIVPRGNNDHRFLLYLLTICLKGIEEATARTTVKHLSHSAVEDKYEALPSHAEQQKIAECLGSVDDLIAAQARKLDALKTHKKGLMQQLFPREGETQPRLRFPEFQNAGEWARISIQEMIDKQFIVGHLDGNHGELYPKAEEFSQTKEGIPYITANDFINGTVEFSRCKRLPLERARLFKKGVAKDGDILFAHNATVGPVAKLNTEEDFVILSTTATYFRCNAQHLSNDFLKSALSSPEFVAQYSRVMSQSTRNQVPITTQRKLELNVPKPAEQQRIATCLSSLDALITAETQKHEALKTHTKGLMDQLFPSPKEVEA